MGSHTLLDGDSINVISAKELTSANMGFENFMLQSSRDLIMKIHSSLSSREVLGAHSD